MFDRKTGLPFPSAPLSLRNKRLNYYMNLHVRCLSVTVEDMVFIEQCKKYATIINKPM